MDRFQFNSYILSRRLGLFIMDVRTDVHTDWNQIDEKKSLQKEGCIITIIT